MNTLSLNIVTPNGSVYEREDVELAVLQTTAGEMGIMSGHIPTVAALKTGYVKVNFHNGNEYIAVSDGFVEVRQHKLSISSKQQKLLAKSMLRELNWLSREQNHI